MLEYERKKCKKKFRLLINEKHVFFLSMQLMRFTRVLSIFIGVGVGFPLLYIDLNYHSTPS